MNPPGLPRPGEPLRCLIAACEPSGDLHAAALMASLRQRWPGTIVFRGVGGDAMTAAGLERLHHSDETAVMGLWEVLPRVPFFARLLREMAAVCDAWRPHVALTVDAPGFNLRLARRARARGIPTVHYVCPQVWAWRRGRVPAIAAVLDRLLVFFPFEPACFQGTGLEVTFVGHPLVDRARETFAAPEAPLPWEGRRRVALLPGSRAAEVGRLLPGLLAAGALLDRDPGDCSFVLPAASPAMRRLAEEILAAAGDRRPARLAIVDGQAREVLRQAHAAAVASGTATLEASLMRCPTVLVYRVSPPTFFLARRLVKGVRFIGLANILAGREIMPELIQDAFSPEAVAARLRPWLRDPAARAAAVAGLDAVNRQLGEGGASDRAAEAVIETIRYSAPFVMGAPAAAKASSSAQRL